MTGRKGTSPATRSRAAPTVVTPRNKVNVALPFSRFTVQEPMKMTVGDWISLAGLDMHRRRTRQPLNRQVRRGVGRKASTEYPTSAKAADTGPPGLGGLPSAAS
jgi:hypothetical protein